MTTSPERGPTARPAGETGQAAASSSRVCYLHIGLHKTATSTLQQMILRGVHRLAASGIYLPETSTENYRKAHHELAAELNSRPGRRPTEWFEGLRDELQRQGWPERLLLSSEDFSREIYRDQMREKLRGFFDPLGYRIRVIVYLRPQSLSVNSTYAQHVKTFLLAGTFDEYLGYVLQENPPWFDYAGLLTPVLDDGGLDCDVRPFNRATLERGVEEDFLTAIGVPPGEAAAFEKVPLANRTPGPKTIAACLEITRRFEAGGLAPGRQPRKRLYRRLRGAAQALGWEEHSFSGLTPETAEEIRAHFSEGNNRLSRRVWGKPWEEVFADEIDQPVASNQFYPSAVSPDERAVFDRFVDELWEAAKAELAGRGAGCEPVDRALAMAQSAPERPVVIPVARQEAGHAEGDTRRICYLHIGLHKTASSSMQQMILRNVERLAAAGIYVPETSTARYSKIHHELAAELNSRSGRPDGDWFARLRAELASQSLPSRILLSSEDFSRKIHRDQVRQVLGSFFDELGYRIRVIVYVRPQDRSMNSTYAQHVKGFLFDFDFDEYRERVFRHNPVWFDYRRLLTPLLDDPGFDCDVRPFNRATLQRGVEEDLLSAIGVPLDEAAAFQKVPPANRTPGPKTIAACLEITLRMRADGLEPARARRKRVSRRLRQTALALGWEETQFSGLTPQTAGEIRERYAEGNDLLSRRVWGRPWAEVFAAEIAQPVLPNRFDPAAADPREREEFERAVEDLWETAKAEMAEKQL